MVRGGRRALFGHAVFGEGFSPDLKSALIRADGKARSTLFEARRAGVGTDQRKLVESLTMPIAVLNGAEDPFINLDYIDGISFKESLARTMSENRRRRACAVPSEAYRVQ